MQNHQIVPSILFRALFREQTISHTSISNLEDFCRNMQLETKRTLR